MSAGSLGPDGLDWCEDGAMRDTTTVIGSVFGGVAKLLHTARAGGPERDRSVGKEGISPQKSSIICVRSPPGSIALISSFSGDKTRAGSYRVEQERGSRRFALVQGTSYIVQSSLHKATMQTSPRRQHYKLENVATWIWPWGVRIP